MDNQLNKELSDKTRYIRDPNNPLKFLYPLKKCAHNYAYEIDNGRWVCETCMTLFSQNPRVTVLR